VWIIQFKKKKRKKTFDIAQANLFPTSSIISQTDHPSSFQKSCHHASKSTFIITTKPCCRASNTTISWSQILDIPSAFFVATIHCIFFPLKIILYSTPVSFSAKHSPSIVIATISIYCYICVLDVWILSS
jgi:hypothetical protein